MKPKSPRQVAEFLHEYLKGRAAVEGQPYDLSLGFIGGALAFGMTIIFGVELNEALQPIRDAQEPQPGYFDRRKRELLGTGGQGARPRSKPGSAPTAARADRTRRRRAK